MIRIFIQLQIIICSVQKYSFCTHQQVHFYNIYMKWRAYFDHVIEPPDVLNCTGKVQTVKGFSQGAIAMSLRKENEKGKKYTLNGRKQRQNWAKHSEKHSDMQLMLMDTMLPGNTVPWTEELFVLQEIKWNKIHYY